MPTPPSAGTLLLVPTPRELARLTAGGPLPAPVELVGFGPVAAAAATGRLLAERRPERAILLGLAGTYDPRRFPLATARTFDRVVLDGVGAGEGAGHLGPRAMGLPQWEAGPAGPIHDELPLDRGPGAGPAGLLLTACAAAGDARQRAARLARWPGALGEDMEAFGVALAATLAGVPLTVLRGASNVVGDRDLAGWCVAEALGAVRARLDELLGASGAAEDAR